MLVNIIFIVEACYLHRQRKAWCYDWWRGSMLLFLIISR